MNNTVSQKSRSNVNNCTSQQSIGCKNASLLNNSGSNVGKCAGTPELKELIKFYLMKDGCGGWLQKPKSMTLNKEYVQFDKTGGMLLSNQDIKFNTPKLNAILELVAKKTPFVSGEQLKLIHTYVTTSRIMEQMPNNYNYVISNIESNPYLFYDTILRILLATSIITKIKDTPQMRILNEFYGKFDHNIHYVFMGGFKYKIDLINLDMPHLDLFFKLYNHICSEYYHELNIQVPTNMIIYLRGEDRYPLESMDNLLFYLKKKGYITLNKVQNQNGGAKKKRTKSTLSTKTVEQLRKLMKKHGKKCSKDGKKFTKDQMIRTLRRC